MRRRDFLSALPAAAAATSVHLDAQPTPEAASLSTFAETMFLDILRGYLKSLAKTSDSYAVIEYPGATVTKSFLAKSGLSVTGVTRMMPAIAAWIAGRRQPGILSVDGKQFDLLDVFGSALVNGTNPASRDYWQPAAADRQDQRQVEASIVAWSAWLLRDSLLPQLTSAERANVNAWLETCTRFPVRSNNWAWFTAVNQAARMALKDRFDEFSWNQPSMFDDLKALDAMYAGDGWYNDDRPRASYDYYNSWVFASHFLYWNALVGSRFPEWSARFAERLKPYLETAPLFFGANGSHVLYGRSLIYRFGVLTPLVLAFQQQLWPHDAGTLHRVIRGNLAFHWTGQAGDGFDRETGKLRETYTRGGTTDIHESYIDGGHPSWGMQAFALWLIPRDDPFWTAFGVLPVERASFRRAIAAPGLVLAGHKPSGQVKLLQARSTRTDWHYRDKYNKLIYSTHSAMDIVQRPDVCPWDNCLVVRDRRTRKSAGRGEITEMRLLPDGAELAYPIEFGGLTVRVRTTVVMDGDFELRAHRVMVPREPDAPLELCEGSAALGLASLDDATPASGETWSIVQNRQRNALIASWTGAGWSGVGAVWDFGSRETAHSNVLDPAMLVNTLWTPLNRAGAYTLYAVHYSSPKPLPPAQLQASAQTLLARARALAAGSAPVSGGAKKPAAAKPTPKPRSSKR